MRTLVILIFFCAGAISSNGQPLTGGFPFVLPHDDSTTAAFLPAFPARPISDLDFISAVGDDFHRRGEQIRFFGGNIVADAAFPLEHEANAVAPRIRKMGMNLMRFHHIDNPWSDHGIFPRNGSTRSIDEVQRDRLEYLIHKLKQEGVYVNMNLNVSRTFTEADGVAGADSMADYGKGVTLFDPYLIELQKEYAAQILTHVNPYTGLALVDDPVLAMVEVANENSLYYSWRTGALRHPSEGGSIIARHARMLDDLWAEWITNKYGTTEALDVAWNTEVQNEGDELVTNGGFESGIGYPWQLEYHGGAQASAQSSTSDPFEGNQSGQVSVTTLGPEDWRVQFKQVGLSIVEGETYTVRFALRADQERTIPVGISKNVDPWTGYASYNAVAGTDWRTFEFTFAANTTVSNDIRLSMTLGGELGAVSVDAVSIRPAGRQVLDAGESVENQTVRRLPFSDVLKYADARVQDMTAFYIDLQDRYYSEMFAYLRNDLGVRVPLNGTNYNFGLVDLAVQSQADYMDNHNYWDHPSFPNEPWSPTDWSIQNTAMVNETEGGTIGALMAGVALADKPYTISEYNHAFPNRYQNEGVLFLGAYAAFHDVDGLMFFDYNSSSDWSSDRVDGFFSIHRNPAFMALMPSVAKAYRDGLVSEARTTLTARYADTEVLGYPALDGGEYGGTSLFPRRLALEHRIVTESFGGATETNVGSFPGVSRPPTVSDTRQLRWDPTGIFTVAGNGFEAATGFLDRFEGTQLGMATIAEADGFGTLTWVTLDDQGWGAPVRSLVTLAAPAQNTGMGWDGASTVHNNWGTAPTIMERRRVVLHITEPMDAFWGSVFVHTLDGTGAVTSTRELPDQQLGYYVLELDQSEEPTVWWGIEITRSPLSSHDDPVPFEFGIDGIYPNPASQTARLVARFAAPGTAQIEVFDVLGRRAHALSFSVVPGVRPTDIDVSGLAAGVYTVRVTAGIEQQIRNLIVR